MIEKLAANEIHNMGRTYTTLPNDSLDKLDDAITVAVWTLLISKPRDWVINCENICKRLKVSRRKYYESIASLKQADLCREYVQRQNHKLKGKILIVVSTSNDWEKVDKRLRVIELESCCQFFLQAAKKQVKDQNKDKIPEVTKTDSSGNNVKCSNVTVHKHDNSQTDTHTNKVNIQITQETNKAAAKEEVRSQHRASLQQPVSAAAFSCDAQLPATSDHIGDKLTLSQITHIKSKLSGLTTDSVTTPAILQHAVVTSLLDSQQFTGCHPHFAKKLNAITKCFREGCYSPHDVLAQKRQAHDAQYAQHNQQRLGELMHSYRVLCGDIKQLEQLASASSGEDLTAIQATLTQKHKACLALKTTITQLKATIDKKLTTSPQATTGLDSPACEVGLSTALSTDCVDKAHGEGIPFHTTRSQSSC